MRRERQRVGEGSKSRRGCYIQWTDNFSRESLWVDGQLRQNEILTMSFHASQQNSKTNPQIEAHHDQCLSCVCFP